MTRSIESREKIRAAWGDAQTGRIRRTKALARGGERSLESRVVNAAVLIALLPRKYDIGLSESVAFIDVVIDVAHRMQTVMPSLLAPRLWRMLAEWAYNVDAELFLENRLALPDCFDDMRVS